MNSLRTIIIVLAAGFAALSAPVLGQRTALAMLDRLESGQWELRMRDKSGNVDSICLHNGRQLIQLRHPARNCHRLIVMDTDTDVIVQYTCPGSGYGRTHIRRETDRLVQLDSQGIANGSPFAFASEARRVGDCGY